MGGRDLADDRAVLDPPEFRIAVPALQAHAVEQRHVDIVVVEIHRTRLGDTAAAVTSAPRLRAIEGVVAAPSVECRPGALAEDTAAAPRSIQESAAGFVFRSEEPAGLIGGARGTRSASE